LEGAVKAVKRLGEIDRRKCRRHFDQHFSRAHGAGLLDHLPTAGSKGILIDHRFRRSSQLDKDGITQQYYIAAKSSPADDRARVLKYGRLFSVFDRVGDSPPQDKSEEFVKGYRAGHCSVVAMKPATATTGVSCGDPLPSK
jgi:hypothetical protein